jgi:hypothetical protein
MVRLTGDQLAIPDIRGPADLAIAARIAFSVPALGDRDGWHVTFGRELNATDDRQHFLEASGGPDLAAPGRRAGETRRGSRDGGQGWRDSRDANVRRALPIVEGKQIQPFEVDVSRSRFRILERTASTLVDPERTYRRARLAYRDVAASSNRLTLIAAILPAGVLSTHTLFCIKERLDDASQECLCGLFNSYVANYLVRQRVVMHVTTTIIERLPVPRPAVGTRTFDRLAQLSRDLGSGSRDPSQRATLQALAARLYGLSAPEFQHVLDSFPLVALEERAAAMHACLDLSRTGGPGDLVDAI